MLTIHPGIVPDGVRVVYSSGKVSVVAIAHGAQLDILRAEFLDKHGCFLLNKGGQIPEPVLATKYGVDFFLGYVQVIVLVTIGECNR